MLAVARYSELYSAAGTMVSGISTASEMML
jgi:hypothetical protein